MSCIPFSACTGSAFKAASERRIVGVPRDVLIDVADVLQRSPYFKFMVCIFIVEDFEIDTVVIEIPRRYPEYL